MAQRDEETRPPRRNAYAAGRRLIANIGATTARFALEPAPGVF